MNAHHDNASTWRDLQDALTPAQIAYLEDWEAHPEIPPRADGSSPSPEDHARALLFSARDYLSQNSAAAVYADVAPPPDDGVHYPWQPDGDGGWVRYFTGTDRKVGSTTVMINGMQHCSGSITRSICIDGETEELDSSAARRVAAAMIEAADELERLQ